MRKQYQGGYIRRAKRRNGPEAWEYLWREETADGKRIRHTQVIGTVDQYPTEELASRAVNGLRARINEECYRRQLRCVFLADVIDHFLETVLYNASDPYAESTKQITPATINTWILPRRGSTNIRDVRVKDFRDWLRDLRRKDGRPLADSTKAQIRNVTRRLFSHAIECEWLEQGKNVIKLVKQSALRQNEPDPFKPEEVQRLLNALESPYREMVLVVLSFGLRRSELFALQWRDFGFERNELSVRRKIYGGKLGKCKTKASRSSLPMPRSVAVALIVWRKFTAYKREGDFLFPSIQAKGMTALDPKDPMEVIQTAARLAGITKRVHWHGFRYTYGSWLIANGVDIAVVHELMRHASPRTTLEFYIKARKKLKMEAQDGIERLLFPGAEDRPRWWENSEVPAHIKEKQKRDALNGIASLVFGAEESAAPSEQDEGQMDDKQDYLM